MPIIEVDHLHKRYGDTVAVDDVSFSAEDGEVLGIVGPNGAGKTTTVECVVGMRRPDRGRVRVGGVDPWADRDAARQLVGIQLQEARLPGALRVGEALELYASFYRHPEDTAALARELGLDELRSSAFDDLSGGQQQRLSIALALVGRPRVAILDELTTGLDPQARHDTWQLVERVRERGVTVVLVSHSMEEVERLCDRVLVVHRGKVRASGSPRELVAEVVGTTRIRVRTDGAVSAEQLTRLPAVQRVSREGRWWVVGGGSDLRGAVTATLAQTSARIEELVEEPATLEHAYLALTSEHDRIPSDVGGHR